MRIVDRYILREMLSSLGLGLLLFTVVLFTGRLMKLMELIVTRGVPAEMVLTLFLYLLPSFLVITVPMAVLLGTLSAYGRLAADSEVLALRTAGWSLYRLIVPALLLGMTAVVVGATLSLVALPWGNHGFRDLLFRLSRTKATLALTEGLFSAELNGLILYAQEVDDEKGELKGIFVADARDPLHPREILAARGRLHGEGAATGVTLALEEGTLHSRPAADPARYRLVAFRSYEMRLDLAAPGAGMNRERSPREMTLTELAQAIREAEGSGRSAAAFAFQIHQKFANPAAALVFVLVGAPLGIQVRRSGRGASLALSVLIALAYYLLMVAGEGLATQGRVPAAVGAWLPNVVTGGLGLALLLLGGQEWRFGSLIPWGGRGHAHS
jgi:lipopolysaccharide export system permease protein